MKSILVVGGGIIGLAVAREIQTRYPDVKILVLEKESRIAMHQTGHNSGVIHSGIYYAPGSLKAQNCLEGVKLLHEFCDRHKIERRRCGKLIVAISKEELEALEKLFQQGLANRVPNIRIVSREEMREIEPAVCGVKAVFLPEVCIVNFQKICETIKGDFEKGGGEIRLLKKVTSVRFSGHEVIVETDRDTYAVDFLVNCAGLYSDQVARLAGCQTPVRIIPFRGEYFRLRSEIAKRIQRLVYPIPDHRFPFLGVHLTPTLDGQVKVGPNAVLALAQEGYSWRKVNFQELSGFLRYRGFWKMAARYWYRGGFELLRSLAKPVYAASARNFLPDLKSSDLLPGDSGVRAQAINEEGEFIHDFLHLQQPRALHILNAPSPAATASLAIARRIVDLLPSP